MKKFTKVLISFCMLFVLTFSLTACKEPEPENTFVPPAGIDMTSAESYASWLDNNLDETLSYTATISDTLDGATATYTIKYQYKYDTQLVAIYDGLNMISYMEIYKDGREYDLSIYDVESKTYLTDTLSAEEFYGFSSSMFGESLENGNTMPIPLMKMRVYASLRKYFANMTANTYLNFMKNTYESITTSSKTISNPADGKYELCESAASNGLVIDTTFTYEQNIIQSFSMTASKNGQSNTMSCTYKYGFVSINFDKTEYSLLTNS